MRNTPNIFQPLYTQRKKGPPPPLPPITNRTLLHPATKKKSKMVTECFGHNHITHKLNQQKIAITPFTPPSQSNTNWILMSCPLRVASGQSNSVISRCTSQAHVHFKTHL